MCLREEKKLLHQAIVRGEFTLRSISKLIRLERVMLNIFYEIFIRRAQEQLIRLPENISISPHLEILRWGFKCSRENLCKCKYMCAVCSQAGGRTHRHAHSHTWLNGLIGFREICIWMHFLKYGSNKRSLKTVLIIVLEEALHRGPQSEPLWADRRQGLQQAASHLVAALLTSTSEQRDSWGMDFPEPALHSLSVILMMLTCMHWSQSVSS